MNTKILAFAAILTTTAAHAASPDWSNILPRGAQRGTETTFTLYGNRLADAEEIIAYSPEFFEIKELAAVGEDGKTATAKILVKPGCPLGEHQFRLRTKSGISYLRTLWVSQYENAEETEPNNEFTTPVPVGFNRTINGELEREDVDFFSIELKKDQRISLEIEAMRLGQETIDPYIAILDSKRFELAASDDTPLLAQDGHLTVTIPEDGTYIIEVRESSYDAQRKAQYRLHIGDFPRPTAVFPPGGRTGEEIEITFRGDAGGDITTKVKLPDTPTAAFPVFAERDGVLAPSPNYLRVAPYGSVTDVEPNNHRKQATAAPSPAPLAFQGIIAEPKDQDWFSFSAKKNQTFTVQTFARSLRSPLDAVTNIYYAKDGKRIEGSDDKDGSPDGSFTFKVPEDGEYVLSVRDHLYKGGPDYVYRIETIPSDPFLQVGIPQFDRNDTQQRQFAPVPRGNRFATLLNVTRANCKGDVKFIAENLPPGITFHAETLPDGQGQLPVVFEAAPDAQIGGFLAPLNVALTEHENVAGKFHQKLEMPRSLNNRKPWRLVENDLLPVTVTEEAPFKIEVELPPVPVVQAGTLGLKVTATRREGFTAPINLRMLWNPPGIGSNNTIQIPKDKNEATYNINANGNAQVRDWKIAIQGEADAGQGLVLASSALTPLKVEAPFLRMKFEMVNVVKGGQVDFVADVEHLRPFEGTAKVKLYGLPAKCTTVDEIEITKDTAKVTFPVTTDPKSPVGKHKNLFCNVWVPLNGTTVHHTVAQGGTIRIDNPPPPEPPVEEKVAQAPKP